MYRTISKIIIQTHMNQKEPDLWQEKNGSFGWSKQTQSKYHSH